MKQIRTLYLRSALVILSLGSAGCLMQPEKEMDMTGAEPTNETTLGAAAAALFTPPSGSAAGIALAGETEEPSLPPGDFDFCSQVTAPTWIEEDPFVPSGHYGRRSAGVTIPEDTECPPYKHWEILEPQWMNCSSGGAQVTGGEGIYTITFDGPEPATEIFGTFEVHDQFVIQEEVQVYPPPPGRKIFCDMTIGLSGFDALCEDENGDPIDAGFGNDYCEAPDSPPVLEGPDAEVPEPPFEEPVTVLPPAEEVCHAEAYAYADAVEGGSSYAYAEAYSYGYGCAAESYAYAGVSGGGRAYASAGSSGGLSARRFDRYGRLFMVP